MKSLKFVLSAGLLGVLAWRMDWSQVAAAFRGLRVEFWLAAVGAYVLTQFLSAYRWQLLAEPLGFRVPYRHYLGFYFIGMFFNLVLPTSVGGDVVRAWYLDRGAGRRLASFLSVLVDRGSGLLVLLSLACVTVAFCPPSVPGWVPWCVWTTGSAAVLGGLAVLFVCCGPVGGGLSVYPDGDEPGKGFARLLAAARLAPTVYLSRPGLLLSTTLLSVGVQAANVVIVWLIGRGIGADVPAAYYWVVVPMVSLLTLLPVSLNGMGIREGGLVVFLAPVGVAAPTAVTMSLLWFAVMAASSLAGGVVYLGGRFPRPEVQAEHEPVRRNSPQGRTRQPAAAA